MAEIDGRIYRDYLEARQKAKDAKDVADELAAMIKAQAGEDSVLTVDGTKVGTYERIKKFAVRTFVKDHPDLAEQFTEAKYVQEVNERKLARMLPEIYAKYQVRQLKLGDE